MSRIYFTGTATAVAQISDTEITDYDAATTYTLTVGIAPNTHAVSVAGDTDPATTAAALVAAWNDSTHPYTNPVVATNPSAALVTLTAFPAGAPFTVVSSKTGGTGTIDAIAETTSSEGPNDLSTVGNYSGGALPSDADDFEISNTGVNICWNLDALNAVNLNLGDIKKTYTGRIGLDYRKFATSADGVTTDATKPEYRQCYMELAGGTDSVLTIGEHEGPGAPEGSGRIYLELGSGSERWYTLIVKSMATSADTGRPALRLRGDLDDLDVRSAVGGVGLAAEVPGETLEIPSVRIAGTSANTRVVCGDGFRCADEWKQTGGNNVLRHVSTVAATGTLTLAANAADTETVVIGGKTYTWKDTLSETDGYVQIGATRYMSLINLAAAINLDGRALGQYAGATTIHSTVSAINTSTLLVVTAKTPGTGGNAITSTETMANGSWGGATLSGGTNGPMALIEVDGGMLLMEGDFGVTQLTNGSELGRGGTIVDNHIRTVGNEIETVTLNGGSLDTTGDGRAKTYGTLNPNGGKLVSNDDLTINTINRPSGRYSLAVS